MPSSHQIYVDLNLLRYTHSGHVTLADHRSMVSSVLADPGYRADLLRFSDLSALLKADLGLTELIPLRDHMSRTAADLPHPIRWSLFAPTDLSFGMARMWQSLLGESPQIDIEVFTDPGLALEYLQLYRPGVAERLGLASAATGT